MRCCDRRLNWNEYEFKGKPDDPTRMPPQIAPYHLRLDWLMWFAAMSSYYEHPWFVHFVGEAAAEGDRPLLGLLKSNPFPDQPPQVCARAIVRVSFRQSGDAAKDRAVVGSDACGGIYFPAVSLDDPAFRQLLQRQGWM